MWEKTHVSEHVWKCGPFGRKHFFQHSLDGEGFICILGFPTKSWATNSHSNNSASIRTRCWVSPFSKVGLLDTHVRSINSLKGA